MLGINMCDKETEKGFPWSKEQMEYFGCYKLGQYKSFDEYCIDNFGVKGEDMPDYRLDYEKFKEKEKQNS